MPALLSQGRRTVIRFERVKNNGRSDAEDDHFRDCLARWFINHEDRQRARQIFRLLRQDKPEFMSDIKRRINRMMKSGV